MANVPPHVNGIMDLTEEEILIIKEDLIEIQDAFVPDDYVSYCDTQYLVSHYNDAHPDMLINGDTANYCLQYVKEEPVAEEQPVTEEQPVEEEPVQEETPPTE
ncbi:hypothetical protein ACW5UC_25125 [Priestia aryabhattai]|uniref:hypothetical protein n=1 Tax=Priestia megaterium TaxID=1404 RepID=UPI003F9B6FB8